MILSHTFDVIRILAELLIYIGSEVDIPWHSVINKRK